MAIIQALKGQRAGSHRCRGVRASSSAVPTKEANGGNDPNKPVTQKSETERSYDIAPHACSIPLAGTGP
jgi:hypothetical protein